MSTNHKERLDELDEEVSALHEACEQYELAIELIGEMFTALAIALPRDSGYSAAAERITRMLAERAARVSTSLPVLPVKLAEQFRDDLQSLAAIHDVPPPGPTSPRTRFNIINGGKT